MMGLGGTAQEKPRWMGKDKAEGTGCVLKHPCGSDGIVHKVLLSVKGSFLCQIYTK